MIDIADGIQAVTGRPRWMINIYLIDGILVDAGTPSAQKRIFRELGDVVPESHLLTHGHPDHFGSSAAVRTKYGIEVSCGEIDADAVEQGKPEPSNTFVGRNILSRMPGPPACPVDRRLKEGDRVGRFEVFDVPGHSRGHIALWCAGDSVLVLGDVLWNLNILTLQPGLHEPPAILSIDLAQNRESARRLAALKPELVLFGHGPPLRDPEKLSSFLEGLPA